MKVDGPGLGLVTFADGDLSGADPSWYCTRARTLVEAAHALKTIEEELYKVLFRNVIPKLPRP